MSTTGAAAKKCSLSFHQDVDNILTVVLRGTWKTINIRPTADEIKAELIKSSGISAITFDSEQLLGWDSSLLTFLIKICETSGQKDITVGKSGLPQGVQRLLSLAEAVPERKGSQKQISRSGFFERTGARAIDLRNSIIEVINFIGEAAIAMGKFLTGRSSLRLSNLIPIIRECSSQALPIVSLISFLVGLILAFVGAVQLSMFGAQIYVASLVGIAMVRVMGAVMAGIIMAGRTGAAFAAQLGTMEVNEEIDALKTMGISPMEFLVLPRIVALTLSMPLLCIYADLMGVLGGMTVGVFMLDLNIMEYYNMTCASVKLKDFLIGIFHSGVFGILVALSGCLRGIQCRRSASAVGNAATSAVVTGIVCIVIATAIITVICNQVGI